MTDPTLADIADKIDDVSRMLARQSTTLGELADPQGRTTAPDVPLLVELHALRVDALACAATARSRRERAAFEATAAGLERLMNGRGGQVVAPRPGEPFSSATMEAVEVVATTDAAEDRTVAALSAPGLEVGGRGIRPAQVTVHRHQP